MKKVYISKENLYIEIPDELISEYSRYNGEFSEEVANYLYETAEPLDIVTVENVKKSVENSMLLIISVYKDSSRLGQELDKEGAFTYDC